MAASLADELPSGIGQATLGETYYVRGDFPNAARAFAEGFQKYPKSGKAPDNLLKLGMSLQAQGKPEQAWPKIVEGRLTGWYKERVLLDQPYVRDEKQSVAQLLAANDATLVRYGQLFIGG